MMGFPKHLLDFSVWSDDQIYSVFETANKMSEVLNKPIKKIPVLNGFTIATVFFEESTRTRLSFELAATRMSAEVLSFTSAGSSIAKGESYKDTILTLDAMGVDAFIIRSGSYGLGHQATKWVDVPIINAGESVRAHPTQALLDAYTLIQQLGTLENKKIAIIGDIIHSRVANSNAELLPRLGANVWMSGPPDLLPKHLQNVNITYQIDKALADADAVMTLRIQKERIESALLPGITEYAQAYQINKTRLKLAKPNAYVLHPGPMNRDVEIESSVADGPQSLITKQVFNGQPIRMAVLYHLLAGRK